MKWVVDIMNMTAEKSLGWRTPLQVLTGQTTDISIALCFLFWMLSMSNATRINITLDKLAAHHLQRYVDAWSASHGIVGIT